MSGRECPECGTPNGAGGALACGCAQRAARAMSRAEATAAAEEFDPLRIRPYVTKPGPAQEPPPAPIVHAPPAAPPRAADVDLFPTDAGARPAPPPVPDGQAAVYPP
ncbi:peptidoglycan-binding protein, partial [Streptomyces sp. E11-3]